MADFCKQCSIDIFGEDFRELAGITSEKMWKEKQAFFALCEGCGPIQVDPDGNCVSNDCTRRGKTGHGIKS